MHRFPLCPISLSRPTGPLLITGLLLALAAVSASAQVLQVPGQVGNLQQAINQVPNGGVIEIAQGTYFAPANGFRINNANARKNFTIRAAAGAAVTLSGGGAGPVLRIETTPERSGRIFLRGLTFADGVSTEEKQSGGVSLIGARAVFVDCVFENNLSAPASTGGGGVVVFDGAEVSFVGSRWSANSSPNRGGGMAVTFSTVYVHDSVFENNRVNLPGHQNNAPGGGLYVLDSRVRVSQTVFTNNQAGWVGGGIYAFGSWNDGDLKAPSTDVLVTNSTFIGNKTAPAAGSPPPGPTVGGGIHAEDHVELRVVESLLLENEAEQGGGINNYRALTEVRDSVLRGNRATGSASLPSVGGALYASSQDFSDATTSFGAINRPSAVVRISHSLFQGRFGATVSGAQEGACVFGFGDINRQFGDFVPADGTAEQNRTRIEVASSIFHDCDSDIGPGGAGGFGGGITGRFAAVEVEDSLFLDSDSLSAGGAGGAMALFQDSSATITETTFANNSASRAGALFISGSEVMIEDSQFLGNEVSPGTSEPVTQSRGAAIMSQPNFSGAAPERATDARGEIANTLFSGNIGLPVFELDQDSPPINRLTYNGNRFFNTTFGSLVFTNILLNRNGSTVSGLNSAVISRSGAPSTDKSQVANQGLGSAPADGKVLSTPRGLAGYADRAPEAFLGSAFTRTPATLGGQGLAGVSDLRTTAVAGERTLRVTNQQVDAVSVGPEICTVGPLLCLNQDRYLVDVDWRDFRDNTGLGEAEDLTADTGYFFFFNPANVELVTKVLDARPINGHYWLFYGALSNVEYTLRALDTETGQLNFYRNPSSNFASVGDTIAFPENAGKGLVAGGPVEAGGWEEAGWTLAGLPVPPRDAQGSFSAGDGSGDLEARGSGSCNPGTTVLCLRSGRFAVEIDFKAQGKEGEATAVPLTTDTGYFFFFRETNIEVILKVLDGRVFNDHFWVFYGALSDVEYTIRVTDTVTGFTKTYFNPAKSFAAEGDTMALPAP